MQVKLFTKPISDNGAATVELNSFLQSHRVIDCQHQLITTTGGAYWCFCVRYIVANQTNAGNMPPVRKDYKNELDGPTFTRFTVLREIRKAIAIEDKIPAFAICTDEELAAMALLGELNKPSLLTVKGFGEKKFEKFGTLIAL